jgi:hypothetical protein
MFGPGLGRKIGKKAPRRIAEIGTEPGSGAGMKEQAGSMIPPLFLYAT